VSLLIEDTTVIDPAADGPVEGSLWIEEDRIKAVGPRHEMHVSADTRIIDGRGKYVIPGLMNANAHLLADFRLENLARHYGHFEALITEAAQVALKNGMTTIFDTWGPRRFLMTVRDRINAGDIVGSRVFCAGNIIGFDGPYTADFANKVTEVASAPFVNRINAIWTENVGRHLIWLTPEDVAAHVRSYIAKGIDFVKYGSNDHFSGAFLQFSAETQRAIVDEAHRAGITAQAHAMSVEGLRLAIEAGCDLVTHCNITGPVPIPESTLQLFPERDTGAVIFPWTDAGMAWLQENVKDAQWTMWKACDINARNLIEAGARLLLGNDGGLYAPELAADPMFAESWVNAPDDEQLISLSTGHFYWFRAMEEKGCPPMEMLRAATRNIAVAYGLGADLGTLEPGKIADVVVLERDPLKAAENYRRIHLIIKDGRVVDHAALPASPILTQPTEPPAEEEAAHVPFVSARQFPMCPMCVIAHGADRHS
jgi:imidazolonepropionase-like amidohydrolase